MENVQESAKKTVKRVDFLTESDEKIYSFTKNQALEVLKKEEVTESEQMLNKWCRDGEIDSIFISKGSPKGRGLRISEKSLKAFVLRKKGDVEGLILELEMKKLEIESLEQQLKEVKKELKELKTKGIKVEKKDKEITLENPSLSSDNMELTFKYKRSGHSSLFGDNGELISIMKKTRGKGSIEVLEKFTDEEKQVIIETRKNLLKSNN